MQEMPNLQPAPCRCFDPEDDCGCACGDSERVLRHVIRGEATLSPEQREWCLAELNKIEGYDRADHINDFDRTLASSVLAAWTDYARDKGLM